MVTVSTSSSLVAQLRNDFVAPVQARAGAAHVQALKTLRMKAAAEAGKAPAPHEENVLTHWVRSAADMRLKVCAPSPAAWLT